MTETFNMEYYLILSFTLISFGVVLYNSLTAPTLRNKKVSFADETLISILIPARNEEKNIGGCLDSLINQSYLNYEIIVLDDESTDSTPKIVNEYAQKDNRIKLINGKPLPQEWLGKNWACHNLSKEANGKILLLIDADVRLAENAISTALQVYNEKKVQMLSSFPTQIIKGYGARIIVPLMNWLLLSFLPLRKVYTSSNISFSAANGQFIMIDKNVYEEIGGHESVKERVVEDMELIRSVKKNGYKVITVLGGDTVFCEMYSSFKNAFNGFSKNFYPGFNINPALFMLMLVFFVFTFFYPFLFVFFDLDFLNVIAVIILSRILITMMTRENSLFDVLIHPLQMIALFIVGINSVLISYTKRGEWKGRKI